MITKRKINLHKFEGMYGTVIIANNNFKYQDLSLNTLVTLYRLQSLGVALHQVMEKEMVVKRMTIAKTLPGGTRAMVPGQSAM